VRAQGRPPESDGAGAIDPSTTRVAERERFDEFYSANLASLLAYASRRTRSPEDAADAVSETFLVAWRRIGDVPQGDDGRLWLYGVARRVLANQRRSEARRTQLSDRLRAELSRLPQTRAEEPQELGTLRSALERLLPADRELLGLIAWEGLGPAELAKVLGCSQNAAKIRTHRARRRLRRELAALDGKRTALRGHESPERTTSSAPLETGEIS
jgi:RNA polymerase sigma factor (sigma-70 family)